MLRSFRRFSTSPTYFTLRRPLSESRTSQKLSAPRYIASNTKNYTTKSSFTKENPLSVFIVGGSGNFGARLVNLLKDDHRFKIILAGRSLEKATKAANTESNATLIPTRFDRSKDIDDQLKYYDPDIIVDASGPFQRYSDPYALPRAALKRGVHYVDLADSTDFVTGISALDKEAKEKGVFILSGLSTYPSISGAVLEEMEKEFDEIHSVESGVAPSPHVSMGESVIEAITSYAGKPVGNFTGILNSRSFSIRAPGSIPLGPMRYALVDVPDRVLLHRRYASLKTSWQGGGTRPQIMLQVLRLGAYLVSVGLIKSLVPYARFMAYVQHRVKWGEHRGGFFQIVGGTKNGEPRKLSWHLMAYGSETGPYVPVLALACILKAYVDERKPLSGARPAEREVPLKDYIPYFTKLGMDYGFRDELLNAKDTTLYERIYGPAYTRLAPAIQRLHSNNGFKTYHSMAQVSSRASLLTNLIRMAFGFPHQRGDVRLTVTIRKEGEGEVWVRNFGGKSFTSHFSEGKDAEIGLLIERFGPFSFAMALTVDQNGQLDMYIRRWRFFQIPLPLFLAPQIKASEKEIDGKFAFDVSIGLPFNLGEIVHYKGTLHDTY